MERVLLCAPAAVAMSILAGCGNDTSQTAEPASLPDYVVKADATLKKMTLDDEITLVTGGPKPANDDHKEAGFIAAIAHDGLDIPGLFLNDSPNGVGNGAASVTRFPTGITVAASWSRDVAQGFGDALGAEWAGKGSNVGLGPGMNIDRLPYNGRTAEYFSEDPYLASQIAVAEIHGIQGQHVIATAKHFAANNEETDRSGGNSIVSERALREIYLPQFEASVKDGGVGAVMCSYNKLGGTYACENPHLLTEILRDDWGFTGFVMSDWGALHSTAPAATAGMDMDMPGTLYPAALFPSFYGDLLKQAVGGGDVPRAVLDGMARRILTSMYRVGVFDHRNPVSSDVSTDAHRELAETTSEEGTVLLQNRNAVLPLAKTVKVAVIGGAADASAQSAISGSGAVTASEVIVTPLAGISDALGAGNVTYAVGSFGSAGLPLMTSAAGAGQAALKNAAGQPGFDLVIQDAQGKAQVTTTSTDVTRTIVAAWPAPFADPQTRNWKAHFTSTLTIANAQTYVFSLTGTGTTTFSVDGTVQETVTAPADPVTKTFRVDLSAAPHAIDVTVDTTTFTWPTAFSLLTSGSPSIALPTVTLGWEADGDPRPAALAAASAADVAIVCVSDSESEGADHPAALPGDQDDLVAAVAGVAKKTIVVLNSGSPLILPWADKVDVILENWYGGQRMGTAIARIVFGDVNPSGKLPVTFPATEDQLYARQRSQYPGVGPDGAHVDVHYDEDIFVGYRWFDDKQETPLFPFGFGLSYTTFGYDGLRVTPSTGDGTKVTVTATVTNTGNVAGKEVAELYVGFPSEAGEPPLQLKGFEKVSLDPGQSKDVTFMLERRAFSYWKDPGGWTATPGTFDVAVGGSSRDTPLRGTFTLR